MLDISFHGMSNAAGVGAWISAPGNPTAVPPANYPKQAAVVIHGMGEQMPMDTITGFVRAVWETNQPKRHFNDRKSPQFESEGVKHGKIEKE